MSEINQEIDHISEFKKWLDDPETKKAQAAAKQRWDDEMEKLRNDLTPEMVIELWPLGNLIMHLKKKQNDIRIINYLSLVYRFNHV